MRKEEKVTNLGIIAFILWIILCLYPDKNIHPEYLDYKYSSDKDTTDYKLLVKKYNEKR